MLTDARLELRAQCRHRRRALVERPLQRLALLFGLARRKSMLLFDRLAMLLLAVCHVAIPVLGSDWPTALDFNKLLTFLALCSSAIRC